MLYTHEISININPNSILTETEIINIVQGDVNTNKFIIAIKDNGSDYTIEEGTVARLMARKTDGTQVFVDCTIINNKVEILMPQQSFSAIGDVNCSIGLYSSLDDELLISLPFTINVIENPFRNQSVYSSNEYSALTNVLLSVDTEIANMESEVDSAIEATSEAVSDAVEATNVAVENTNVAIANANTAAENANAAADLHNIEEKTEQATEAANNANQAASNAELATTNATNAATDCYTAIDEIPGTVQNELASEDITKDGYHRFSDNATLICDENSVSGKVKIDSIIGSTTEVITDPAQDISPSNTASLSGIGINSQINIFSGGENIFSSENWESCSIAEGHPTNIGNIEEITIKSYSTNYILFTTSDTNIGVISDTITLPKGQFTLSFNNIRANVLNICKWDTTNDVWLSTINTTTTIAGGNISTTIEIEDTSDIRIVFANTASKSNISLSKLKLQFGSTATAYCDYVGYDNYIIKLKDQNGNNLGSLYSLPNGVSDVLIKQDGTWGIQRNCAYLEFDGTEGWAGNGKDLALIEPVPKLPNKSDQVGYCTHYENILNSSKDKPCIRFGEYIEVFAYGYIYMYNTGQADLASFKSWLASQKSLGTPVTVIYPRETSEFTALSEESQITLENIESYGNITNLRTDELAQINATLPKGYFPTELDEIYPVNSVFISAVNKNPGAIFGGTWVSVTIGLTGSFYCFKRTA